MRVSELYEKVPEQALALIDSAEQTGAIPDFRAELLRAKLYTWSTSNQRQDVALQIAEALLSHDSVKGSTLRQQEVLELLVNASRMRHDDEQWMRWAMRYAQLLRNQGNESEALRTEAEIGMIMTHLGQLSEGMKKIDFAIRQLDGKPGFNAMLSYILACKRKITVLRETGQHIDILPVAQDIQHHISLMEASPTDYIDGSQHAPKNESQLEEYCDFYGAQAMAFTAAAYAELGDRVKARQELVAFGATQYGHTLDVLKMTAPTLGKLGDYTSMLAIYDKAEAELKGDTLRQDYADILLARAEAAEVQGHVASSLGYRKRYEALVQTLNDRLHRNQSHDYAARYHAQEQQMEIERQQAEISSQNLFITMASAIMLLAFSFAIYFFRQKRLVDHKNHVLVEQMSGAINYKQKFEEATHSLKKYKQKYQLLEEATRMWSEQQGEESESNSRNEERGKATDRHDSKNCNSGYEARYNNNEEQTMVHGNNLASRTLHDAPRKDGDLAQRTSPSEMQRTPDLNAMSDEQLFQYMSEVIISEKLHLKPVCDRQVITSRFGLSEKRVGAAFAKGSSYKSLASFVRDSRLEYAAQLLHQHPDMTIGDIATASGFSSHTRFTADFKTRYSVSPTEFRSMTK
ncbi:MAG: AraC family transcriptional regulator [Prevotella sp.]|nr:AraC family transcriptional regulator [Prevotella sp.]